MVTRKLAALHGLGPFVGGLELRVHPLVAEEARAILGDAVAAHQADGLAHHVGAVAGVPQLAGRAEHVGDANRAGRTRTSGAGGGRLRTPATGQSMASFWTRRMCLERRGSAFDSLLGENLVSSRAPAGPARRTGARRRSPARRRPRPWPRRRPGGAARPPSAAGRARSAASPAWRSRRRGTGRAGSGSPARRPRAAWPRSSRPPSRACGGRPPR